MNTHSIPFVAIPFKDGIFRIWTDIKGKAYKLEVRSEKYQGYHDVKEFPKVVKILAGFIE